MINRIFLLLAFINIGICTSLSAQNEEEDDDDQETSSNFISTQGAYSNLLIQAINENDAAKVAEAIKNVPVVGGYIPTRNANHISYFLYAVANSTPEVIKTMLANDAYAKSGINTYRGNTPLMIALLNARQPGVADFLYQNGFNNVDEVCPNGYTALHKAIVNRNIMAIQWLLDHKANINSVDFLGHTPLMYAIINHSPTMVNFLLKYKPDINTIDFLGTNALGYTNSLQEKRAKQENISHDDNVLKEYDSIRVLLEKNKAVNITLTTDRRNLKPQQIAFAYILFGDTAGIKTLLQNGLDVESRNSKGQTLLQQAVMNKDATMIKLLKRYNANANTTDYMGNDMLMQACESFDEELIPYIVLAGHIKGYEPGNGRPLNTEKQDFSQILKKTYSTWQMEPRFDIWQVIELYMNNNDTEITNIMRYNINSDDAGPKLCKQYYLVDKKVVEFANAYERLNADDAIRIFLLGARHEDIDLCKTLAEKNTQLDHQIALRFADIYFPMNNSRYFTELRPLLKPAQIKSKKKK